jgi:hypothetical protein
VTTFCPGSPPTVWITLFDTTPAPYDPDNPSQCALYCPRCVFLNPAEVESPYWHQAWLAPGAAVCETHRLPLVTLKGELVRRSHNLPHLLKRVGRQELDRRELARAEGEKAALARSSNLLARSEIPNRIRDVDELSMLRRFLKERQENAYEVFAGTTESGTFHTLHNHRRG